MQEQLKAGHLEPSTSPWNTPIFVIQKKNGTWRLLQDLREVNKTMQIMGPLQPGLPSPVAIPNKFFKIVIDLKDCFFSIPLHPDDRPRFAFSIPITNHVGPTPRFQWRVLPQGMANSPTLCQKYVAQTIDPFRVRYSTLYIVHYMDDILVAGPSPQLTHQVTQELIAALSKRGFVIAPEKVQTQPPLLFLGFELHANRVMSQKTQFKTSSLKTLNDFQKLLGDINWLRPYLKLTTGDLKPLFEILQGDPNPASLRSLTKEASQALSLVEEAIEQQFSGYFDPLQSLWFLVLPTAFTPTGLLWQGDPLFWVHLSATPSKVLPSYPSLVCSLIRLGRLSAVRIFGREPDIIVTPYDKAQRHWLEQFDPEWALTCTSYPGKFDNHYPANRLVQFLTTTAVVFPQVTKNQPLPQATLVFVDGSSNGRAAFDIDGEISCFQTTYTSAQLVELQAVIAVFSKLPTTPFNLYSDSAYVVNAVRTLETVPLIKPSSAASQLFATLQQLIVNRKHPFFIGHIRAHSGLPGPLSKGNDRVDQATRLVAISFTDPLAEAKKAHTLHHLNANTLRHMFKITREQARDIVKGCKTCVTFLPEPHLGVNPRGLIPGELWQMDVTHYPSFGTLKYLHVTIDTFSGYLFATAQTGEATKHVVSHLIACFAHLGVPKIIKTDNGPGYTSSSLKQFCAQMQVKHVTGVPYNPQGQGIVERAHLTLKTMLTKLATSGGLLYPQKGTQKTLLNHALFVLNFLSLDNEGRSAADRFWHPQTASNFTTALWKDPLTAQWRGPDPVLIWGKGHACIYDSAAQNARWLPDRLIKPFNPTQGGP